MKRTSKGIRSVFSIIVVSTLLTAVSSAQQGDTCTEYPGDFTEHFTDTIYKDEARSSVDNWGGDYITLQKLGADFDIDEPGAFPAWINTVASGDFDGDGWDDFIGTSSSYANALVFIKNLGGSGNPSDVGKFGITLGIDGTVCPLYPSVGDPTRGARNTALYTSGAHCGMTSGDYDKDGDLDFLYVCSYEDGSLHYIWLYQNMRIENGSFGTFTRRDLTSVNKFSVCRIHWSTTMMQSIDWDNDGDIDIVQGNMNGQVLLWRNTTSTQPNNKWTNRHFGNANSLEVLKNTGWGDRGVNTVSVGDLDKDGDLDLFLGSVNYAELRYYKNDGTGQFPDSLRQIISDPSHDTSNNIYDGAATASLVYDFNQDGYLDIVIGTDDWNYDTDSIKDSHGGSGIGGLAYFLKNSGSGFRSYKVCDDRPTVYDFDLGAFLDYDHDGIMDFLVADGNHSEQYYLFINHIANVFNLAGSAFSTNITPNIDPERVALTKVRITGLDMSVIGPSSDGLTVTLYVSSNNGVNWEFYQRFEGSDIRDYSNLAWHTFANFGTQLKWRAELTAPEDPDIQEYTGASKETPKIDRIKLEYIYVDRREYSRSSVVATKNPADNREMIIAATFFFPGWQGHLRAYDVASMGLVNSKYAHLQTVTQSDGAGGRTGVDILWDAGQVLQDRILEREIFTALPNNGQLVKTGFTTGNVAALEDILRDVNGDNTGLIEFVRGTGRTWKLGDIDHSNPAVVGPPEKNPIFAGDSAYDEFIEIWKDRTKVVYVGANDGMLHCFNVSNGEEIWAFIPYNLLPKLKNMWAVDPNSGERYFSRDVYVDGSPSVADVYVNNHWRTVLICGQGQGFGSSLAGNDSGQNFYFALDITNPVDPQPMWEFTHVDSESGNPTTGETWSVPAMGKINQNIWAAFMGSGYDNSTDFVLGNWFYVVNIADGQLVWAKKYDDIDTSTLAEHSFPNIYNAIPGSANVLDRDQNGLTDNVYFGDLDGRLYRLNVTNADPDNWSSTAIYTDQCHYPIITKPALWMNNITGASTPRIYFGTGGDDRAPTDTHYSFIALLDDGIAPAVEWYLGDPTYLGLPDDEKEGILDSENTQGAKVWADPIVADNIVYFTTLRGSIESVNPCENLSGIGQIFGRYVQSMSGRAIGSSAFKTGQNQFSESLDLVSKARRAVTVGEKSTVSGTIKRSVYIQEYNSTVERLEQPIGTSLQVKSWREVYKIR